MTKRHRAMACAVVMTALMAAPGVAAATPASGFVVDHVYLERPPEVRLFLRFADGATAPAAGDARLDVDVNGAPVQGGRMIEPSAPDAAVAVLFLVDTSKSMENWIGGVKRALQAYLEEEAKAPSGLNRFAVSTFATTPPVAVVPFSAAQAVLPEALRGLRARGQERTQVWESCEIAVGRFDLNAMDAAGVRLPGRRYLVMITNGQGNADDTARERCLRAALGAQVPVVVVGPPPRSGTLRALRETAEKSFGRYIDVRGPGGLPAALQRIRAAVSGERLRLVEFPGCGLSGLRDTNNSLTVKLADSRGTAAGAAERVFALSEAFRSGCAPPATDAGGGEDGGSDVPEAGDDAGEAVDVEGDVAPVEDAGLEAEPAEASARWLLWTLVGAGVVAVVVIALAIARSRRRRCPTCGEPLAGSEEVCRNCQAREAEGPQPEGPTLLAELLIREGPTKGRRMPIVEEVSVLGRDPEKCQLVIDDEAVSRVHATFRLFPEGWRITDMSSSFGITMGERKISPDKWADLRDGDTIKIGNIVLAFLDKTRR
ncbi:MAG: FHA domain-containing protein [Myxococcota bacterium]|nr:FHA domain-containing protein [Myxococcota bacterium]